MQRRYTEVAELVGVQGMFRRASVKKQANLSLGVRQKKIYLWLLFMVKYSSAISVIFSICSSRPCPEFRQGFSSLF
jgi:hypothetical protein